MSSSAWIRWLCNSAIENLFLTEKGLDLLEETTELPCFHARPCRGLWEQDMYVKTCLWKMRPGEVQTSKSWMYTWVIKTKSKFRNSSCPSHLVQASLETWTSCKAHMPVSDRSVGRGQLRTCIPWLNLTPSSLVLCVQRNTTSSLSAGQTMDSPTALSQRGGYLGV